MKDAIILVSILIITCGTNDLSHSVQFTSEASGCGGFLSLAKTTDFPYQLDSADYCEAEKLRWNYDLSSRTLQLLHTRIQLNCAAEFRLDITKNGDIYALSEKDISSSTANCVCSYDFKYDISSINPETVSIQIDNRRFELDLNRSSGSIVLDTTKTFGCL